MYFALVEIKPGTLMIIIVCFNFRLIYLLSNCLLLGCLRMCDGISRIQALSVVYPNDLSVDYLCCYYTFYDRLYYCYGNRLYKELRQRPPDVHFATVEATWR